MAAYLTRAEFFDQTIPGDAFADLSSDTVDAAILWASGVADSYLRKRYQLPLISWGEELKSAVGEIAQFKLLSRRGFRPSSGEDEIAVKRYDDAVKWLQDVSRGLAQIGCVDSTPDLDEEGALAASDCPVSWSVTTRPNDEAW